MQLHELPPQAWLTTVEMFYCTIKNVSREELQNTSVQTLTVDMVSSITMVGWLGGSVLIVGVGKSALSLPPLYSQS